MSQSDIAQTESAVKCLFNITNSLPASAPTSILKSYYLTKCRRVTLSGPVGLSQQLVKTTKRCPRCCVEYEDGRTLYQIKPERKKNRFVRRLLKRNANEECLTRFQRTYLKNLMHKGNVNAHNKMVITCSICKHEIIEKLEKPVRVSFETEPVPIKLHKSKKKKKKDRFSGLNKDVVLSMTPQDKSYNTSNFMPLETTPVVRKTAKQKEIHKKNMSPNKKQINTNNNNHQIGSPHKKSFKAREKQKNQKLKGLQSILNNSKRKNSPSVTIKQFLTSL